MLTIVKYPNAVLKKVASLVKAFDDKLKKYTEDMLATMYGHYGVGLAAPQVNDLRRIFVMDVQYHPTEPELSKKNPSTMINPEIVDQQGEIIWEEGCLSLPGLLIPVKRSQSVTMRAQDVSGKFFTVTGTDLMAVCMQHELDHLNGILLTDRLTKPQLSLYKKKMERGEVLRIEDAKEHHPALVG